MNAKITVCGAFFAIMQFCIAHRLSYSTISSLLHLLFFLCPAPNMLPASLYMLKKFFSQFRSHHDYNRVCLKCQGTECSNKADHNSDTGDIIHLDICDALRRFVSDN